ncbi:type II toxin-antitoxin system MqsA family antitoxin [Cupriavidus pinatubonensis]|uniref:Antitoxin MqsA n=1 Tax=Cupriavidus pinatubonensis TaxID=248026 RepID=A0ABN7ZDK5_9BURK|nr:type II toxin-antitoxin system MqsA family antitoxin [Cupriavidus pinatubonensis]CAG9182142.1 Antitoxin MqsA [Cupriavidus pinatubonensis]
MKCPECGGAELVNEVRDVPYTYRGESTVIRGVRGDWCPQCGEGVMPMGDDSLGEAMLAFNREVNARYVDPGFIAQVRRKLRLDQREAAEIFGGGVNAFSRYETGRMLPPVALIKLLKLLDRHPELLEEVRAA